MAPCHAYQGADRDRHYQLPVHPPLGQWDGGGEDARQAAEQNETQPPQPSGDYRFGFCTVARSLQALALLPLDTRKPSQNASTARVRTAHEGRITCRGASCRVVAFRNVVNGTRPMTQRHFPKFLWPRIRMAKATDPKWSWHMKAIGDVASWFSRCVVS